MNVNFKKLTSICYIASLIATFSFSCIFQSIENTIGQTETIFENNIKSSQTWNLNPFIISQSGGGNGTWSWAASQDWCSGSGTLGNPYIIENVTIDCGGSPGVSGITIIDSDEYFIIQNSIIQNSGSASDDAGIKLLRTNNGTIQLNSLSYNLGTGIYLDNSSNNRILENEVHNNQYHGIYVYSDSDNNIIHKNFLRYNGIYSYHGIYIDHYCDYTVVSNNSVSESGYDGIRVYYFCQNASLISNEIYNNLNGIVVSISSYDCIIKDNSILNNTERGIFLSSQAHRTSIQENYFEKNGLLSNSQALHAIGSNFLNISDNLFVNNYYGIYLSYVLDCEVTSNKLVDNNYVSIYIQFQSEDNNITDNYIINSLSGIHVYDRCQNLLIENNTVIRQSDTGIEIGRYSHYNTVRGNYLLSNTRGFDVNFDSDYNNFSNNIVKFSSDYGARIINDCNETLVFQNYFIYNEIQVVNLESSSHWNYTNLGNYWTNYTGYDMDDDGIGDTPHPIQGNGYDYYPIFKNMPSIFIDDYSEYNWEWAVHQYWVNGTGTEEDPYIIQNKIINEDWQVPAIEIRNSEKYFTISNCTLSTGGSVFAGITFYNVENGKVEESTIANCKIGIELLGSKSVVITSNNINYNGIGVHLSGSDDINVIANDVSQNGIGLYIFQSNNNFFGENIILNTDSCILEYESYTNIFENNICDPEPLKILYLDFIEQIFTFDIFNITFFLYNETYDGIDVDSIMIYWNGTEVSANMSTLGNGYFLLSLDPIFTPPGETGIPLELNIINTGYAQLNFYTEVGIEVENEDPEPLKILYLDIVEQIFTIDVFNITIFLYNETYDGIDADSLSIYWDGEDVSSNITLIGNGYYLLTIAPIFTLPGEPGISLEATIGKVGYDLLSFSSEIAVDPESVAKGGGPIVPPFAIPWSIFAILGSTFIGIVILLANNFKKRIK